jgi:hypothetical protein
VQSVTTGTSSASMEAASKPSGCGSGCVINYASVATTWAIIGDAVQSTTSIPDLPSGFALLAIPVIIIYFAFRRRASSCPAPGSSTRLGGGLRAVRPLVASLHGPGSHSGSSASFSHGRFLQEWAH